MQPHLDILAHHSFPFSAPPTKVVRATDALSGAWNILHRQEELRFGMSHITLTQAAKLTGRARSTLHRACSNGRLSFTRAEGGARMIDVAELERVYGPLLKQTAERTDASLMRESGAHHAAVRAQQALAEQREVHLAERIEELRSRLEELRADRDSWKAEAESWRAQAERLVLTTHAPAEPKAKRAGWWGRLFGRS